MPFLRYPYLLLKKYEVIMRIKYIKDAPNGPAGMTDEVSDFHGNILVLTGLAESVPDKKKVSSKPKNKTNTKDE